MVASRHSSGAAHQLRAIDRNKDMQAPTTAVAETGMRVRGGLMTRAGARMRNRRGELTKAGNRMRNRRGVKEHRRPNIDRSRGNHTLWHIFNRSRGIQSQREGARPPQRSVGL